MTRTGIVQCLRTDSPPVALSEVRQCFRCNHDVWITHETIKAAKEFKAFYVCEKCFPQLNLSLAKVVPVAPTEGQLQEIAEAKTRFH